MEATDTGTRSEGTHADDPAGEPAGHLGGEVPAGLAGATIRRDRIGRIARARGTLRRIGVEDALLDVVAELEADDVVSLFTTAILLRRMTARRLLAVADSRSRLPQRGLIAELLG